MARGREIAPLRSRIVTACVAAACLLLFWVLGLGCWPLTQWNSVNCRHEDVDLNTGRIRHQHFLLGVCVSESIEDSPISRELRLTSKPAASEWRRVNTFSPMVRYSPHYVYHSAISDMDSLELAWQMAAFTPEARRQSAKATLALLRLGPGEPNEYLKAIQKVASENAFGKAPITPDKLPQVEGHLRGSR